MTKESGEMKETYEGWKAKAIEHEIASGNFPSRLDIKERIEGGTFATVYRAQSATSLFSRTGELALKIYSSQYILGRGEYPSS